MNVSKLDGGVNQLAPRALERDPSVMSVQEAYALPPREPNIGDYWRILVKRKWTIFSLILVVVVAAGVISLKMTPIYDATARIAILQKSSNFLTLKDGDTLGGDSTEQLNVDTQVSILQSSSLALSVIHRMSLDQEPAFAGPAARTNHGVAVAGPSKNELAREEGLLGRFLGNLHVMQQPATSIIEIRFSSPDPNLAARVANEIASTYTEQNIKARFQSTMQAANWLSNQLADLQVKVETSQTKLVEYQKEHNIIGGDDKQNLTLEKLNEINKELTSAQAERIQKQSIFEMVKTGNPETVALILQDPLLGTLRQQQTDLQAQIAQLSTQFGPAYPKVMELANRLTQVEKTYQQQLGAGVRKAQNDYDTAVKKEQILQTALDQQTAEANLLNESAIAYKQLKQDAEANRQLYDGLLQKLKEATLSAGMNSSNIRIVDNARVPLSPARPNIPRNLGFAVLLGVVGGIAVAFGLEALDLTVRTPDQAENTSGLPTIAVIPVQPGLDAGKGRSKARLLKAVPRGSTRPSSLITYLEPKSEIAEAYRALRTSVLLSSAGQQPRTILVTSALPQDGKTMTSVNTAIVLAQQGKRVLLVDGDLRRPSVHKVFGIHPGIGLTNVLTGGATPQEAMQPTVQPNLFLIPAGPLPPHPSELLGSARMSDLIQQWREEFDHVVIDSPPVLSVTDAVLLSVQVDIAILVIRAGQTTTNALRRTRDLLAYVKANIMGIVLNAVDLSSPDYYYYYYYGKYGYKYGKYGSGYYSDSTAPTLKMDNELTPAAVTEGGDEPKQETSASAD